jgi:hypothetical protein
MNAHNQPLVEGAEGTAMSGKIDLVSQYEDDAMLTEQANDIKGAIERLKAAERAALVTIPEPIRTTRLIRIRDEIKRLQEKNIERR